MEKVKISFLKRVKNAITKFEAYPNFAIEPLSNAIKYLIKIVAIFSLVLSIAFTYKFSTIINDEDQVQIIKNEIQDSAPVEVDALNEVIDYVKNNNNFNFYLTMAIIFFISFIFTMIVYTLIDALLLSIIGFFASGMTRIKLRYKALYIMSIYALTLPIILNCIYAVVNLLTEYRIEYFSIVYNVIGCIYIITAVLMIKTDLIEQQIELTRIVQAQQQINEEHDYDVQKPDKKEDEKEETPKEVPTEENLGSESET